MTETLHDSNRYKTFINDRNLALEQLNRNTQVDISLLMKKALDSVTEFVSYLGIQDEMSLSVLKTATRTLDQRISFLFDDLSKAITERVMRARKSIFILTYLSELEAIARATKKTKIIDPREFSKKLEVQIKSDTLTGSKLDKQTWHTLFKLKKKILEAFQRGVIMEETPKEVVDRVKKAFPPLVEYKKPPRNIRPIREAAKKDDDEDPEGKEFNFYHDLTTDEDWDQTVDAYVNTQLDPNRMSTAIYTDDSGVRKYEWELEQEVNDDFVQQVRDGQVSAANDLGIEDFVWVAIVDKKTCEECCLPRAGKTNQEIKDMLASGELDKDQCDAETPPAHPYCRCDVAPVASSDPVEGPDWKSFDDWLNS